MEESAYSNSSKPPAKIYVPDAVNNCLRERGYGKWVAVWVLADNHIVGELERMVFISNTVDDKCAEALGRM